MPCSIWRPPEASGPVLTVSRPILTGADCAIDGIGNAAADAAAAEPARNLRRLSLMVMVPSLLPGPFERLLVVLLAEALSRVGYRPARRPVAIRIETFPEALQPFIGVSCFNFSRPPRARQLIPRPVDPTPC